MRPWDENCGSNAVYDDGKASIKTVGCGYGMIAKINPHKISRASITMFGDSLWCLHLVMSFIPFNQIDIDMSRITLQFEDAFLSRIGGYHIHTYTGLHATLAVWALSLWSHYDLLCTKNVVLRSRCRTRGIANQRQNNRWSHTYKHSSLTNYQITSPTQTLLTDKMQTMVTNTDIVNYRKTWKWK